MTQTMPTLADLLPLLPELVLAGAAFVLLLLDLFLNDRQRVLTHVLAVATLALVGVLVATGWGGQGTVLSGMFVRDNMADVLKAGICLVSAVALVYGWPFLRERGLYKGEVSVLVMFAVLGMMLLAKITRAVCRTGLSR